MTYIEQLVSKWLAHVAHGYHFDNGELLIFYVVIVRVRIKNINQPSIIVQVQLNGETYHVFHVSFIH